MSIIESKRFAVRARIENLENIFMLDNGVIEFGRIRSLTVDNAMADPAVA
jgi:hypothetical protein